MKVAEGNSPGARQLYRVCSTHMTISCVPVYNHGDMTQVQVQVQVTQLGITHFLIILLKDRTPEMLMLGLGRLNVGKMLTCLAKISLPACGRHCVLELRNAVLGGQTRNVKVVFQKRF